MTARWLFGYIRSGSAFHFTDKMEKGFKVLKIEVDNFIFYQKSKVGLIVGKAVHQLKSQDRILLSSGEDCKIKFKSDIVDLQKLTSAKTVDFVVKNFFEERPYKGTSVKQFVAESVDQYNEDSQREIIRF